jgi:hypothetical protein
MFLLADEVDGNYYVDLILSNPEIARIKRCEMVCGEMILEKKRYYVGVRLRGNWDLYDDTETEPPPPQGSD